jgi:imidazolonepropionase-like amidohydrolase
MIDGKSDTPTNKPVILIDGEKISAVGAGLAIPAGAKVIDLGNVTLLPGLIDVHTHVLFEIDGTNVSLQDVSMLKVVATQSTAERALLGAKLGREDLEAGITTVRDVGNSGVNGDVALRDAINNGWLPGPRIVAATRALAAPGGQFGHLIPEAQKIIEQEYVIVDEAHIAGVKVAAHAIGDKATRIAAEAGVDSIEHAYVITDDTLKMMAQKHIFLVPTDGTEQEYMNMTFGHRQPTPEERAEQEQWIKPYVAGNRDRLQRARRFGVPIAAGSDMYLTMPDEDRGQASLDMFDAYSAEGMTPLEIIHAATSNGAELLGWQGKIGTLEAGKYADIIAVPGDPLQDATTLKHARFVMKGGVVIKNETGNETKNKK